jgi:simple sugar transport system permease protein
VSDVLDAVFTTVFLAQLVRISVPYMLAAMGGTISERSGVVNIALEGKLLVGAFCCAVGAIESGSVFVGAICGAAGGTLVAALFALAVLRFQADQIVAGVAINLMALGLTRYLLKLFYGSTANSPPAPGFEGSVWGNVLLYVVIALVVGFQLVFSRTRFGLRLRAVGEHPGAAATVGLSVLGIRWTAVLISGAIAGLGGAWLALDNHAFVANMSGGRGYIALAAVIMGSWRPMYAALACLVFAAAESLQVVMQVADVGVPRELVQSLPYILTMVAMAGLIGRSRPPAALGKPYENP